MWSAADGFAGPAKQPPVLLGAVVVVVAFARGVTGVGFAVEVVVRTPEAGGGAEFGAIPDVAVVESERDPAAVTFCAGVGCAAQAVAPIRGRTAITSRDNRRCPLELTPS